MRSTCPIGLVMTIAAAPVGCAPREPRAAGRELEDLVEDRTGVAVDGLAAGYDSAAMAAFVRTRLRGGLTRDEAVVIGLLNNRGLQARLAALGVAQADLIAAGLLRNPKLDLHFRLSGGRLFPEFAIVQALVDAFLIPARRKLAKVRIEQAKLELGRAALALRAEILAAVAGMQAVVALRGIREDIVEAAALAAELGQRQLAAGTIPEIDAEALRAAHERSKVILADTELALARARERVNDLLGLWGPDTGWVLREALPPVVAGEPTLVGLESTAAAQRLDVAAARRQVEAMVRAANLARAGAFTGMELGATLERDLGGDRAIGPVVEFEAPIFDWGRAEVARIRAGIVQARRSLEARAIAARAEVRSTYVELVTHRRVAAYYQSTLIPRQARLLELAQVRYDAMLLGVHDLLRVRQDELAARERGVEATRDYWIARSRLELAVGGRLPPGGE